MKTGHYANYVKPHQLEREAEVRELRESLPPHVKDLDEDVVLAIRSKLHPSIRKVNAVQCRAFAFALFVRLSLLAACFFGVQVLYRLWWEQPAQQ